MTSGEALCLEILGNLRRCFEQQAPVKSALYAVSWVLKVPVYLECTFIELVAGLIICFRV